MIEFFDEQIRTARKEHTCELCGCAIHKGEKYHNFACKDSGDGFSSWCLHIRCNNFVQEYSDAYDDKEWYGDEVRDFIRETYCLSVPRVCPQKYEYGDDLDCDFDIFACPYLTEKFGDAIE